MVKIGEIGTQAGNPIPLATRNGWEIPNEVREEQNPISLKAGERFWNVHRPNARIRSNTARYNCMGMVFASRRTSLDIKDLNDILKHDEYKRVYEIDVELGDIVVYRDQDRSDIRHVGIIADKRLVLAEGRWDLSVMSKWGEQGEYYHHIDDVPEVYGEVSEYWTDRRQVL